MNTTGPFKRRSTMLLLALFGVGAGGCAYGGVASTPDGTIVVARNSLLGGLRKIYVCKLVGNDFKCVESTNAP
jgi:hypothetical protein